MLQAFAAAFRTPDLRRKLLFSLAIIAVYRLGASVPGPGVFCCSTTRLRGPATRVRVVGAGGSFRR